jgi:flagellar protein FlaG
MQFATEATHAVSPVVVTPLPMGTVTHTAKHDPPHTNEMPQEEKKVSEEGVKKIVHDINEQLQSIHTELNFSVDKETDRMVLKIVNSKTHEVIRQIPAEDALRLSSRISKLLGVLVDGNA